MEGLGGIAVAMKLGLDVMSYKSKVQNCVTGNFSTRNYCLPTATTALYTPPPSAYR